MNAPPHNKTKFSVRRRPSKQTPMSHQGEAIMKVTVGGDHHHWRTAAAVVVLDAGAKNEQATMSSSPSSDNERGCRSLDEFLTQAASEGRRTGGMFLLTGTPLSYTAIFLSLGVANSSDATEILCLAYILSETEFQSLILKNAAWRAGILAAAVFLGMLVGGLVVGALGDSTRYGRRKLLLFGLAMNCITGLLSAGAVNIWMLSCLRLLAGVGIGATVPPLFTLCSELSPPSDRGFWVTVAASFWMVGSIYVAVWGWILLAWLGASWRVLAAVCAVPSGIGFVLVYRNVPESPRFLALQGHYEAALISTHRIATAMGYTGAPMTRQELLVYYPLMADNVDLSLSLSNACTDFWRSASLLYVPELAATTLNLQVIWFALSFGSYGLLTWINTLFEQVHLKSVYTNSLLFALANLPGNIVSAILMDHRLFGRSTLLTSSLFSAALSLVVFAVAAAQATPGRFWIVSAACTFQACTVAAWNVVDVISSELFPTQVRATGMGLCAASGRLGAMLAQGINGYLVGKPVRLLLVAATTLIIGAVSPNWLPDATGRPVVDRVLATPRRSPESEETLNLSSTPRSLSVELSSHNTARSESSKPYTYQRVQVEAEVV